jgi:hypothetical protein
VSTSQAGFSPSSDEGGSLISRIPVPDGTVEAEVRTTLKLIASGGTYTSFIQASGDSRTSGSGSGTYLAFEMENPQFDRNGQCTANFALLRSVNGSVSVVTSFPHACRDGMVLRMAIHGNVVLLWPDQDAPLEFFTSALPSGQPGIGSYGVPSGNGISLVQLGAINRIAPAAPDTQSVSASAFPRRIDVHWGAVTASAAALGLGASDGMAGYWIYRDGLYFGRTSATQFSDETVSPEEVHTYTIYAVDQHYNFSPAATLTVTAPAYPSAASPGSTPTHPPTVIAPHAAIETRLANPEPHVIGFSGYDPRRVGVMPLGSYWGGAGEQIDNLSGNLNFSLPILTAKSAGGWNVGFRLSYNSQNWRHDSAGDWLIGWAGPGAPALDVGFGFGWKLLAGAVSPVTVNSQFAYYLYIDSTGAEYRLDQNTNNVWTSLQGIYVSYDANAQRLYFNNGSFWAMGCISASSEADAGTLYPTTIQDANGNSITITYMGGIGTGGTNSSARPWYIQDSRWTYRGVAYEFSYNTDPVPHLTSVTNYIQTAENYTFSYLENQPLASPFTSA